MSPFIIIIIIIVVVVVLFIVIFDRWLLKNHCFGTSINQTIHSIYWSLAGPKFAPQSNCKGICRVIVSRHRQNKTKQNIHTKWTKKQPQKDQNKKHCKATSPYGQRFGMAKHTQERERERERANKRKRKLGVELKQSKVIG
jgi:hypothetical protein